MRIFLKCRTAASSKECKICFFLLLHFLRELKKVSELKSVSGTHKKTKQNKTKNERQTSKCCFQNRCTAYSCPVNRLPHKITNYRRLKTSSESVTKFRHRGTAVKNQNCTHEEIKGRLKTGNGCYSLTQNLSSFHLLPKSTNIKT